MKAMTKHRSHSVAFKRQVAEEFLAGETLHPLSKRHDISRQLIRIWVGSIRWPSSTKGCGGAWGGGAARDQRSVISAVTSSNTNAPNIMIVVASRAGR
jgi:hypothetical protein